MLNSSARHTQQKCLFLFLSFSLTDWLSHPNKKVMWWNKKKTCPSGQHNAEFSGWSFGVFFLRQSREKRWHDNVTEYLKTVPVSWHSHILDAGWWKQQHQQILLLLPSPPPVCCSRRHSEKNIVCIFVHFFFSLRHKPTHMLWQN